MRKIWHTHTGSAPGCQDTPTAQVRNWFGNETIRVQDARACFNQMVELEDTSAEYEMEHRCFNRREYNLTLADVRAIIRTLKQEATQ